MLSLSVISFSFTLHLHYFFIYFIFQLHFQVLLHWVFRIHRKGLYGSNREGNGNLVLLALLIPLEVLGTPVLLPGKSHGRRSLVGCRSWGHEESDMTEQLHFHFSLSCIGEGNGNPLQCSCLENPRDGGVWWAAVYGVAQSRTRLKRLSSSSSSRVWF